MQVRRTFSFLRVVVDRVKSYHINGPQTDNEWTVLMLQTAAFFCWVCYKHIPFWCLLWVIITLNSLFDLILEYLWTIYNILLYYAWPTTWTFDLTTGDPFLDKAWSILFNALFQFGWDIYNYFYTSSMAALNYGIDTLHTFFVSMTDITIFFFVFFIFLYLSHVNFVKYFKINFFFNQKSSEE